MSCSWGFGGVGGGVWGGRLPLMLCNRLSLPHTVGGPPHREGPINQQTSHRAADGTFKRPFVALLTHINMCTLRGGTGGQLSEEY